MRCLAALCLLGVAPRAAAAEVRLAVVLSANGGAVTDTPLRYADLDGDRVAALLTDLGGVADADLYRVPSATVEEATAALGRAVLRAAAAEAAGDEVSLLVYYTGHAGPDGLHLGDEVLPLGALKTAARVVPAHDRVFVVDACQSGQLLRSKGATRVAVDDAPTDFEPPPDEAWIASTGAEESAFEVDRRRGALFTHFFVSGGRGAADLDGDARVTLDELYAFVHHQTTATAAGLGQVQHPRWAGVLGDWVVSELDRAPSGVEALGPVPEPLLLVDRGAGEVAAELPPGAGGRLALPPGRYQVLALRPGARRVPVADIVVPADGYHRLAPSALVPTRGVRSKGGWVDVHPWSWAAGGSTLGTPGAEAPLRAGAWLRAERATGRGHHVGLRVEAAAGHGQGDGWRTTERSVALSPQWRLDLLRRGAELGPAVEAAVGVAQLGTERQADAVWGTWYGPGAPPTVRRQLRLRGAAGLSGRLPLGGVGLVGAVLAGVENGAPAARPGVLARLGVDVPL